MRQQMFLIKKLVMFLQTMMTMTNDKWIWQQINPITPSHVPNSLLFDIHQRQDT